jgi:formylmethanofuran dehydrogenase subunit E
MNFCGNSDENPAQLKKKNENNGNVEKFHGILCPYVVVGGIYGFKCI